MSVSSFIVFRPGAIDRNRALVYTPPLISHAEVAEQADAHDSKSCSERSVGSIPTFGIKLT